MTKIWTGLLLGFLASNAMAASLPFTQKLKTQMDKSQSSLGLEWIISEVSVEEVETKVLSGEYVSNYVMEKMDLGQIILVTDQLIALGKKIWVIIEAGKPVISTDMAKPISVLPRLPGDGIAFYEMGNWSAPKFKSYRVSYKNGFGSEVIGFTYTVYFQHSGSYQDKGQYISGLNVEASEVAVSWGFKFDATSALVSIANQGSQENPVASATVSVGYSASSWFSEINTSESFFVNGKGQLQKLR